VAPEPTSGQELDRLRAEARVVEEQIRSLRAGTGESAGGRRRLTATVDADKCLLCRACEDICPSGAITVADKVVIAADKCSGCGACVRVCPNEAIRLV
jgi:ferredoxin